MSIFDYPDVTLKPSINQDRETAQRLVKITYNTSRPATSFKFDKKTFDYDIMFIDMSKNKRWNPRGQQRQRQRQQNMMSENRKKDADDQMSIQLSQENYNKRENKDDVDLTPKMILDQISLDINPMVEEKVEKGREVEEEREQMEQNSSLWISKQEQKKRVKQQIQEQKEQQQQQQQQSQAKQEKQQKKYQYQYQQQVSGSEIDNSNSNSEIDGFTYEFGDKTIGEHSKQNMTIFTKSDKNKNSYIQLQHKSDVNIKMQSLQISEINNNESTHQILQLLNKIQSDPEDQPNKLQQAKKIQRQAKIKQIESLPFKNIAYHIAAQNCKKIILKSVVDFDGQPLKTKKKRNYINITQRQIEVMGPQVVGLEWNVGQSRIKTAPVMLKVMCYCCRAQRQAEYNQDNTCFVLCRNPECTKQICLQFTPKQL